MRSHAASAARSPVALIDTGFILALIDDGEGWHHLCVQAYDHTRLPLLTTEAVLTEVFHIASRSSLDPRGVWRLLRSGAIQIAPIANEELPQIEGLMRDYADRPMDFADATLVHLAARERLSTILTIDHDDFETYRLPGRKKFTILPSRRM
ncbi:MAG TPA: PIN domain-containing protein [Candidatus Acidoferrum sp.]|jgi:predicted nucleic acid-binding protein|nr:PIN domain-containing protein [Candidatus Acidoferrum sp.]